MGALREGSDGVEAESFAIDGADGARIPLYHARPLGSPPRVGIVVHPDIGGLRTLFEELAERLASHGHSVAVFEPFARVDPDERVAMDLDARMEAVRTLDDAQQLADMERVADALAERDAVREMAVIGFCMGGMYTLKAAATGRFDRAVSFYGMVTVPEDWRGPRMAEPLATATTVCPTMAVLGGADPWTPPSDVAALRAAWKDRPDCEIVLYPDAEHGFVHDPERPAHRAEDAEDAWRRALDFLAERTG